MKKYKPGSVIEWRGLHWIVLGQGITKGLPVLRVVHIASDERATIDLSKTYEQIAICAIADNVKDFVMQTLIDNL